MVQVFVATKIYSALTLFWQKVKMRERFAVLFSLKFFEFLLCLLCLIVHIVGIQYREESMPHDVVACGVFGCFLFNSLIGCVGVVLSVNVPLLLETIVDSAASIFFLICSITSMIYVENDEHLMFMTGKEESEHIFFVNCRRQSVFALVTSTLFAMHASLGWDQYFISERINDDSVEEARQPLVIHFLPFRFCMWLGNRTKNAYVMTMAQRVQTYFQPSEVEAKRIHQKYYGVEEVACQTCGDGETMAQNMNRSASSVSSRTTVSSVRSTSVNVSPE